MLDRRTGLLLLGAGSVGGYALFTVLRPVEVEFTRAGPAALAAVEMRPIVSTAHVELPVDLQRVTRKAEGALAQRLAMGLDIADPNCARKPQAGECTAQKLDGAVVAGGPGEASATGAVVRVRLPLKLQVAQGLEKADVEMSVGFSFKVQAGGGLPVEVSRLDEPTSTDAISGAHARVARLVETRLRPLGLTIQDELRAVLSELPVATATERAWQVLSQPIDLGGGNWLKAVPEVAGLADLAASDGGVRLRVPIASRLSVENSDHAPAGQKRGVVHGQVSTTGSAIVRVALPISFAGVQPALDAAFVQGGPHETRPDRFGPPVKVDVRRARIYPSLRQVGVELDIAVSRFEGQTYRGKAHLLGRPVLDAASRIVTLADISLSPIPQRENASVKQAGTAPRLANDPFSAKLASVFRIDVSRDGADALPRVNALLQRRLDDKLSLSARLTQVSAVGFEITKDGGWLLGDLTGTLTLQYRGTETVQPVAQAPQRSVEPATQQQRRSVVPEVAAAAVTSASTLAFPQGGRPAGSPSSGSVGGGAVPTSTAVQSSPVTSAAVTDPANPIDSSPQVKAAAPRLQTSKSPVPRSAGKSSAGKQASAGNKATWVPFPTNN